MFSYVVMEYLIACQDRHTRRQCEGLRNQESGEADSVSDSQDFLGRLVTGTNDRLVLDIGPYRLDIRKGTN